MPSARPQAVLPTCLLALQLRCLPSSLKQCCPLPRGSCSGGATRTRLAVPPARATLFLAAPAVLSARARTMPRTRPTLPPGHAFLSSFGTAPRRCSDGASHTRRDVASPTSVTVHSIASIVEPGFGGGPTLALLRTSQAEFTSPSPSWRLMEDRSCSLSFLTASLLLPSLLAVFSVMTAFHAHVAAVLPANVTDLSR